MRHYLSIRIICIYYECTVGGVDEIGEIPLVIFYVFTINFKILWRLYITEQVFIYSTRIFHTEILYLKSNQSHKIFSQLSTIKYLHFITVLSKLSIFLNIINKPLSCTWKIHSYLFIWIEFNSNHNLQVPISYH